MANVLFDGLPQDRTAESSILYAVALSDSADGTVTVRFIDESEAELGFYSEESNDIDVEAFDEDEFLAEGEEDLVEDSETEADDEESLVDDFMDEMEE